MFVSPAHQVFGGPGKPLVPICKPKNQVGPPKNGVFLLSPCDNPLATPPAPFWPTIHFPPPPLGFLVPSASPHPTIKKDRKTGKCFFGTGFLFLTYHQHLGQMGFLDADYDRPPIAWSDGEKTGGGPNNLFPLRKNLDLPAWFFFQKENPIKRPFGIDIIKPTAKPSSFAESSKWIFFPGPWAVFLVWRTGNGGVGEFWSRDWLNCQKSRSPRKIHWNHQNPAGNRGHWARLNQ